MAATLDEVKGLLDEQKTVWEQMKATLATQDAEIKKHGEAAAETKAAVGKMNDRLDQIETKLNRPGLPGPADNKDLAADPARKAFNAYCRKGVLTAEEQKALSTDVDTQGGYLVPPNVDTRIRELLVLFDPLRELADVQGISLGNSLEIPVEGSTAYAVGWEAEGTAGAATAEGDIAMKEIPTHGMYARPRATQRMLDDTAYNIEEWIGRKVGEQLGKEEGKQFILGAGVGKPEGIMFVTGITEVNSGNASALTSNGIIALYYKLPEFYAQNATWLLQRDTVRIIRQFADTTGQYLWQPGLTASAPATILGRPYRESPNMDAVAANAFPIAFGDWRAAYTIVDRQQINVLRDPYSAKPLVEFYTRKRVGGQVVLKEAYVKQKVAA